MADWVAAKDQKTGRTYYANLKTQESRWTVPPGFTGRTVDNLAQTQAESQSSGGAGGSSNGFHDDQPAAKTIPRRTQPEPRREVPAECTWKAIEDKGTGRTYFYHVKTRETSWNKPQELIDWENAQNGTGGDEEPPEDDEFIRNSTRAVAQSVHLEEDFFSDPEPDYANGLRRQSQPSDPEPLAGGRNPNELKPSYEDSVSGDAGYDDGYDPNNPYANLPPDSSGEESGEEYDSDEDTALQFTRAAAPQQQQLFGQNKYQVVDSFQQKRVVTAEEYENQIEEEMEQLVVEGGEGKDDDYYASLAITQGDRFKLDKYGTTYFNKHKKGLFGAAKCTIPEMISWTGKLLPTSLKKLNSALAEESKQSFKNIMSYMDDRKSSKKPHAHAKKLLKQAISSPEELRDEIYCQLCKQTTNNPRPESLLRGWKLMSLCVGIFPPSEEFACYLSAYFHEKSSEPGEVGEFAKHCLIKLDRTMIEGTRKYCPTEMEIEAAEQRKQVSIRVEFLDGTFRSLLVDSQTLVKQVAAQLVKGMDIENEKSFALAEMEDEPPDDPERDADWLNMMETRKNDQTPGRFKQPIGTLLDRFLEKDERVLDVLGGWEHSNLKQLQKELRKTYRLVFKIRLFHRDEEENVKSDQARRLYFVQAANDVVQGYYPVSEKDSLELGSIQLQANFGVNELSFYQPGLIIEKIQKYVAKKYRTKREHSYLENKILTEHEQYVHLSKTEAQIKYLSIVKKYQTYGCTFFTALRVSRVRKSKDPGEDVVIGISERGLVMLDPVTRNLKHDFELSEILTYGFKDSSFLLVAGNLMQQKKFNFRSKHGREMHDLLRIYIARLVALQE